MQAHIGVKVVGDAISGEQLNTGHTFSARTHFNMLNTARLSVPILLLGSVLGDKTLKLWGKDEPSENDVNQKKTDDCFLEASLAAVVRINKQTTLDLYSHYNTPNIATVTNFDKKLGSNLYLLNLVQVTDGTANTADTVWVAAFQSAYYNIEMKNGIEDKV